MSVVKKQQQKEQPKTKQVIISKKESSSDKQNKRQKRTVLDENDGESQLFSFSSNLMLSEEEDEDESEEDEDESEEVEDGSEEVEDGSEEDTTKVKVEKEPVCCSGQEEEQESFNNAFTFENVSDDDDEPIITQVETIPQPTQQASLTFLDARIAELRQAKAYDDAGGDDDADGGNNNYGDHGDKQDDDDASNTNVSDDDSDDGDDDDSNKSAQSQGSNTRSIHPPIHQNIIRFEEFNLSKPILKGLHAMGLVKPTPIQAAAIPLALQGKDLLGGAVTGSGKTAAFLVPILERLYQGRGSSKSVHTRVLILLPTRELAAQCCEVASKIAKFAGLSAILLAGGLPMREQEAQLRHQRPDLIVATPGRLIDHLHNTAGFALDGLEILVLDEADRMLEEGFSDELAEIIRHCPDARQTMLFSATLTGEAIQDLARLSLHRPARVQVDDAELLARRLSQEFIRIREGREADRLAILVALLKRTCVGQRAIVFLPTKQLAHRVRIILGLAGIPVAELHGGLTQPERMAALERFKQTADQVLVCTDVAARGLDIAGVQTVLNWNMPVSYTQYLHRVGRTARAGQAGRSITMVGEGADRRLLKQVVRNSTEPVKHRLISADVIERYRGILDAMEADVEALLAAEAEERQLQLAEGEVKRAENILNHRQEIHSRPAKQWFQTTRQKDQSKKRERPQSVGDDGRGKKMGNHQSINRKTFGKAKKQ